MILNDGAHGYTLQRQELPGDGADRRQARPEGAHPLHERRDDDPPDAPARHAHDGHREGRLAAAAPWKCDTLNIAPGERWDVIVNCNNPGTWAFHCHILPHAESDHGMFGMVTALVVQK